MRIIKDEFVKKEVMDLIKAGSILAIIFYTILALTGRYDISVILGVLIGSACSIINFVMLAWSMENIVNKARKQTQFFAVCSYLARYILVGAVMAICILSNRVSVIAFVVPLFFPMIIMIAKALLNK